MDLTAIVWSEFVVPTTTGVVESVDIMVSVWSEFVLGDLEFVVPVESMDLMACVGSFEKPVSISPKLSVSVTKTLNHLFKNSILYLSGKVALAQGRSKQSGWSGFGRTTISQGKNKVPFYKKQVIKKSTRVIFGLV